jgi:hypothetical protein
VGSLTLNHTVQYTAAADGAQQGNPGIGPDRGRGWVAPWFQ